MTNKSTRKRGARGSRAKRQTPRGPRRVNRKETFPTLSQLEFIQNYGAKHGIVVGVLMNVVFLLSWFLYQCLQKHH